MLLVWWALLHLLLAAAVVLIGWPPAAKALALAAVAMHAGLRRPPAAPRFVIVEEGGRCAVPEWHTGARVLGTRTLIAPFWVRLDLGKGPWRRELLLLVDQVESAQWRRLRALLARALPFGDTRDAGTAAG